MKKMKAFFNILSWSFAIFAIAVWYIIANTERVRADRVQNEAVELGYAYYDNSGEFTWKQDCIK